MPFPRRERLLLQHARTLVDEAGVLFASTDYPLSGELATRASVEAKRPAGSPASRPALHRAGAGESLEAMDRRDGALVARQRQPAVIVYKEKNLVELYHNGNQVKQYAPTWGRNSIYPKRQSGDAATPEGRYRIVSKNGNSRYFKALLLDYPNADDRARFRELQRSGECRATRAWRLIEIHGEAPRPGLDIGLRRAEQSDMNDLYSRAEVGTPVTIVGGNGRDGTFSDLARSLLRGTREARLVRRPDACGAAAGNESGSGKRNGPGRRAVQRWLHADDIHHSGAPRPSMSFLSPRGGANGGARARPFVLLGVVALLSLTGLLLARASGYGYQSLAKSAAKARGSRLRRSGQGRQALTPRAGGEARARSEAAGRRPRRSQLQGPLP